MFEQLTDLVKQFSGDAVVNNPAVPNEHNDAVIEHASGSILDSLKNIASQEGGLSQLTGMLQNGSVDTSNPAVQQITNELKGSLGEKFGLNGDAASSVAGGLIPSVLGSLMGGNATGGTGGGSNGTGYGSGGGGGNDGGGGAKTRDGGNGSSGVLYVRYTRAQVGG